MVVVVGVGSTDLLLLLYVDAGVFPGIHRWILRRC
jgi:hypothetical protein